MRELADRLRELRLERDLTIESVAQSLLVSPSKISRLETAQRSASQRDVRDLCLLYRVPNEERDHLMAIAAQALETSWYQDLDLHAPYMTYVGLEEAAAEIHASHALFLHGLLQTPAYATELVSKVLPPGRFTPARVKAIVDSRMKRQGLLNRPQPLRLHLVLDEQALLRPIGGAAVMAEQVAYLLERSLLPHVVLQLIRVSRGAHPGLDGKFAVLRFSADQQLRDTVYIEGLLGELFLDKEHDVTRYSDIFDYLATHVALDEASSRGLLEEIHTHWSSAT